MKHLHSPLPFRNGLTLRNRVMVPAMASQTASTKGFVTQGTLDHYARLARSGASLVMVEYTYVHPSGRSEDNQLAADDDLKIAGLTKLAQTLHQAGASVVGLQLTHAGGKSSSDLAGGPLQGPSAVPVPVKDRELETPHAMTPEQIGLWKESFINAAFRARASGFDMVELHSAHGYGLNQWLSPLTNHRGDAYGGSLENRMRLLLEIVQAIRREIPDLLISVRMPGQDFIEGGLTQAETQELARTLESEGVDLINVSSGIGGWRRPGGRQGEGYLVPEASAIQSVVSAPVVGVGGIHTSAYVNAALANRMLSLAAVGRAILNDPDAFRREVFETGFCLACPDPNPYTLRP